MTSDKRYAINLDAGYGPLGGGLIRGEGIDHFVFSTKRLSLSLRGTERPFRVAALLFVLESIVILLVIGIGNAVTGNPVWSLEFWGVPRNAGITANHSLERTRPARRFRMTGSWPSRSARGRWAAQPGTVTE